MHDFLRLITTNRPLPGIRFGVPLLMVGLATLLRLVAPLDVAPFLLYLPIIVLGTLALGRGAGWFGLGLSTATAAYFFVRADHLRALSPGEWVALAQYVVVGAGMVLVCGALRKAFIDNENTLGRLDEANRYLTTSREHLKAARQEAVDARDAAEDANRAKSEFLANMSHELRTPLSAIIGYSEMMLEDLEDREDDLGLGADMKKIEGNARHLLGLINDVLDLSKVESGKMEVYLEDFEVEPTLRDLAITAESLLGKKNNVLKLELGPELGHMRSDLTKVRQVLLNFLSNAAKFTENGTVTLRVVREIREGAGDRLRFSVADTGIGMTEEQVGRLFHRFQQADSSTTRRFGGTGLGLSLTRAFADMLGGHVDVESKPGEGSTFSIELPADAEGASTEASSAEPDPPSARHDRDLVLVIDDDSDQRALMTRFLHREGFRVQVATNGTSGLELAAKLRPKAILLDVMMPGIDGWSVLSRIKADEALKDTPVVMVTAVQQRNLADALGASDYVQKPIDWDRLAGVVDRFRAPGSDGRGRVLLVDDDALVRESLRDAMEPEGWTLVEAKDGREGLEKAAAAPPQLVLLDLNMPVMDGFKFLEELRQLPGCAETPVVVMTGRNLSPEDRRLLRGATQILNRGDLGLAGLVDRLRAMH